MIDNQKTNGELFKYTEDDPQPPPSPLLAEYMAKNNIDKKMNLEDARKWFNGLRATLAVNKRTEKEYRHHDK